MSTVKIATTVLSNSVAIGAENNPISTIVRPDHKCCYSIADLVEGRTYNFTTTMPLNNPAVLVTKKVGGQEIITRRYDGNGENQPFSVTIRVGENRIYVNNSENSEVVISYNNEADFDPKPANFGAPQPFRFWCQTVLPLVYDDSLSYYELLAKVVKYLNALIKDVSNVENIYTSLTNAYAELEAYVNTYFDNLDVSEAINEKLDYMADHGDFDALVAEALQRVNYTAIINAEVDSQLPDVVDTKIGGVVADQIDASVASQINAVVASQIGDVVGKQIDASVAGQIGASVAEQITPIVGEQVAEQIGAAVSNWLARNFTNPPVDKSLSIDNAAADAKVVGKALKYMSDMSIEGYSRKEEELTEDVEGYTAQYFSQIGTHLALISDSNFNAKCANNLTGGARYKLTLDMDTSGMSGYTNTPAGYVCANIVTPESEQAVINGTIIGTLEEYIGQYPNGDYYIDLPYNATAILFNSQNAVLCKAYIVTNEYLGGGDSTTTNIEIEEFAKGYIVPVTIRYGKKVVPSGADSVSFTDDARYCCVEYVFGSKRQDASIRISGYQDDYIYVALNSSHEVVDAERFDISGASTISYRVGGNAVAKMYINTILNPHKVVQIPTENQFISEGIPYITTEPNFPNTSGFLRVAVLDTEPSVRRAGWLYIIKQSVENGIILYEGANVNENALYGTLNNEEWGTPI